MKTFEFEDQWGDVTAVRLVRGAYADGSLAVQALREGDGYWEPFATLTVNPCDARNQNASYAYVDTGVSTRFPAPRPAPLEIPWDDGRRFKVDGVSGRRRAHSLKVGDTGMRNSVRVA